MKFSLQSLYGWYREQIRNPKYRPWMILGTIAYIVSPIDISPDFIPFIGQVDDFLLLSILLTEVSQMVLTGYKDKKGQSSEGVSQAPETSKVTTDTIEVDAVSVE